MAKFQRVSTIGQSEVKKKGIINLVHGGACREIMVPTNPKTAVYNTNRQSSVVETRCIKATALSCAAQTNLDGTQIPFANRHQRELQTSREVLLRKPSSR